MDECGFRNTLLSKLENDEKIPDLRGGESDASLDDGAKFPVLG